MILVENHRSLEFESNDFVMNIGGILRFHMLDSRISSIIIRPKCDDHSSFHTKIFGILWIGEGVLEAGGGGNCCPWGRCCCLGPFCGCLLPLFFCFLLSASSSKVGSTWFPGSRL